MYLPTVAHLYLRNVISCVLQILDFDHPLEVTTKFICEEILYLCDYSPPPLVSTLMTYRAPLAGLLAAATVTYVYWEGLLFIL